jgi:hypothetical protein
MTNKACLIYLDQAIASLQKMRTAVNDLPPEAAVNFLEAAQEAAEMLGKSVATGIWTITKMKHEQPR